MSDALPPGRRPWATALALAAGLLAWSLNGGAIEEAFTTDPAERGWEIHGLGSLFQWDAASGRLGVRWDSAQPNSFFFLPLGRSFTRADDFEFGFDLALQTVEVGVRSGKPHTFQISAGLIRRADAFLPGFLRGTGTGAANLVEFDYFPDSGFGATISPAVISATRQFATSFTYPVELEPARRYHLRLAFTAADRRLRTTLERDGAPMGPIKDVELEGVPGFSDFSVDAVAISSYSDEGGTGSILAEGSIDNLFVRWPEPPTINLELRRQATQVVVVATCSVAGRCVLERSEDFLAWTTVADAACVAAMPCELADLAAPELRAFYRVRWAGR
jgi:hypothetical protein